VAKYCGNCGAGLSDGTLFCGTCGKQQGAGVSTNTSVPGPTAISSGANPKQSSGLVKVVLGLVALFCVGGAMALGGTVFLAYKAKQKAAALEKQVLGGEPSANGGLASLVARATSSKSPEEDQSPVGDPCRFLSKEEISQAIGAPVVRAEKQDSGCTYFAKGDPAEMTSKHMSAMITSQAAASGDHVDPQQKKMMDAITGAFFKQQEKEDKQLSADAAKGEAVVLAVSFSSGNADTEMKLNRGAFNRMKGGAPFAGRDGSTAQTATGDLAGIGDEAYLAGGSILIMRKGNTVVRFIFTECPCNAEAITPLAKKVASQI